MADIQQILDDPNFHALPLPEKNKVMLRVDPNFRALSGSERMKVLDSIQYGPSPVIPSSPKVTSLKQGIQEAGKGVADVLSSFGQGVLDIPESVMGIAKAAATPPSTTGEYVATALGPGALVAKRMVLDPMQATARKAEESTGSQKYGYAVLSAIPMAGPVAANVLGGIQTPEDIPKALARGLGWAAAGDIAGAIKLPGKKAPLPDPAVVKEVLGRVAKDQVLEADTKLHAEVSKHAEHLAKIIDDPARNPGGAIPSAPIIQSLQQLWDRYIKTYSSQLGAKPPAAFEGVINEAMSTPTGKWGFDQTKQIRSAVSEIAQNSKDAKIKAVAKQLSRTMRDEMKTAAGRAGLADEFELYNRLHSRQARIREQVIDPIRDAISGEKVMGILHSNRGYVEATFPSLDAYGLESKPLIDAVKISEKPTAKMWKGWMVRHASAELLQGLMGVPYMAGYFAGGLGGEMAGGGLSGAAKGIVKSPYYSRGAKLLNESLPEPPSPTTEPTPIPAPPEAAPKVQKALPPLPEFPKDISVDYAAEQGGRGEVAPEVVASEEASKYAQLHEKLGYLRNLNSAIRKLSTGTKKPLTDAEVGWIESETGLDMTEPASIAAARKKLMEMRNSLRKTSTEGSPRVAKWEMKPEQGMRTSKATPPSSSGVTSEASRIHARIVKMIEHGARNQTVRDMITYLEDTEKSPRLVMDEFWSKTFPTLSESGRKQFIGQMKTQFGMKPGDVLFTDAEGKIHRAESWREIMDSGLQDDIASMEQPDQAIVGLAEILNEMKRKSGNK